MLPRQEAVMVAVPEQTARVAQMAFPKGNVYIWMRDELGQIYLDWLPTIMRDKLVETRY